jgi:hypothetical protein
MPKKLSIVVTDRVTGAEHVDVISNMDKYDLRLYEVREHGVLKTTPEDMGYERQKGGYLLKVR